MAADQAHFQQLLASLLSTDNDVRQQAEVSPNILDYGVAGDLAERIAVASKFRCVIPAMGCT